MKENVWALVVLSREPSGEERQDEAESEEERELHTVSCFGTLLASMKFEQACLGERMGELWAMSELDQNDLPPTRSAKSSAVQWLPLVVGLLVMIALGGLSVLGMRRIKLQVDRSDTLHYARRVTLALKLYAADNDGFYPDEGMTGVTSSNVVFDELLGVGIVTSENIFGGLGSSFRPDLYTSTSLASLPNQVHWSFVTGRNDASKGASAIVFENSLALSGVGAPTWGPPGDEVRGRSWVGPNIIIATNDGAVQTFDLRAENYRLDSIKYPNPFDSKHAETGKPEVLSWVGGQ